MVIGDLLFFIGLGGPDRRTEHANKLTIFPDEVLD